MLRTCKIVLGLQPSPTARNGRRLPHPKKPHATSAVTNPNSEYFLSILISYPNEDDAARARKQGVRPGGAIMIHGQPNIPDAVERLLCDRRLDRRMHCRVELRHGRDLAHDAA